MIELAEIQKWFRDKSFGGPDWATGHVLYWVAATENLRASPAEVLEIGSYEGRSAIAFLEMMPLAKLTAVDWFPDQDVEVRFDRNMAKYPGRVTKLKGRAMEQMDSLYMAGRAFDLIYLDAGKVREGTLAQAALAWGLLRVGGVLIFDDLIWGGPEKAERERPRQAIQLFMRAFATAVSVLPSQPSQAIVRKSAGWPVFRQVPLPMRVSAPYYSLSLGGDAGAKRR